MENSIDVAMEMNHGKAIIFTDNKRKARRIRGALKDMGLLFCTCHLLGSDESWTFTVKRCRKQMLNLAFAIDDIERG